MRQLIIVRLTAAALALVVFSPAVALAQTNDICGYTWFWDDRAYREDGSYLPEYQGSNPDKNRIAKKVKLYLYDQDGSCGDYRDGCGEGDDDLLATTYSSGVTGYYCFNDIGNLEDIYLVTAYESDDTEVRDDWGWLHVQAAERTYTDFGVNYGDLDLDFNITCVNEWENVYGEKGHCASQPSVDQYFSANVPFAHIMQSAVDVDVLTADYLFYLNGHSDRITGYYPEYGSECDGTQTRTFSCDEFCIEEGKHNSPYSTAHEIGHILMKRALGSNCSGLATCGSSHGWDSIENNKCATSEGWADFVGGATYWPENATSPHYKTPSKNLEGDTEVGNNGPDQCVNMDVYAPYVDEYSTEGNVARHFWDLYDSTWNDDYRNGWGDSSDYSFAELVENWDNFPSGTFNHQRNESDSDGRNTWDYRYWMSPSYWDEIHVNCLENMDTN